MARKQRSTSSQNETLKTFLLSGFYAVVTRPLIRIFTLEIDKLRLEMDKLRLEVKADMAAMELRLNDRIDARLVRH